MENIKIHLLELPSTHFFFNTNNLTPLFLMETSSNIINFAIRNFIVLFKSYKGICPMLIDGSDNADDNGGCCNNADHNNMLFYAVLVFVSIKWG